MVIYLKPEVPLRAAHVARLRELEALCLKIRHTQAILARFRAAFAAVRATGDTPRYTRLREGR